MALTRVGQFLQDVRAAMARTRARSDIALLLALWLIYLLPFTEALPFIDGIRDLQFALDIASGESWPLVGPVFANRFHLGPFGYYLQALPLVLGFPLSSVPMFLGALAGSKFFLAYGFGRDWIDRRYGLLFAAALALPGWSGLDFLNTTTPMLVPALLLAAAWSTLRFARGHSVWALFGAALASSLALQSHPSALILALLPAAVCLRQVMLMRSWGLLFAAIGVGLLPLLPALISVARGGWVTLLPQATTVTVAGSGHSLLGWIEAVRGFAIGGPLTTLRTLGSAAWGSLLAWTTLLWSLAGMALLGRRLAGNRQARQLAGVFFATLVLVFAARSNTPWYFMQVLTLAWGAAAAWGWHQQPRAQAWVMATALVLALVQGCLLRAHLARGEGGFASVELMDVRAARGLRGDSLPPWISVRHWEALAELLCADPTRSLALHGALARAVDDQGGLAARGRCDLEKLRLGGTADRHWLGLPRALWSALQWSPQAKIGSIGVFTPDRVFGSDGHPLADPHRYPLRAVLAGAAATQSLHLRTADDALLVISQLSPTLGFWSVEELRLNGVAIAPLHVDSGMRAYRAAGDGQGWANWELRISASSLSWVDIVSVRPQHSAP